MAPSSQQLLESLQFSGHHTKKGLVVLGSVLTMTLILGVWILSGRVSDSASEKISSVRPDFSLWQTVQGGSGLVLQDLGSRLHFFGSSLTMPEKSYVITPTMTGVK